MDNPLDTLKELSESTQIQFIQGKQDDLRPEEHYKREIERYRIGEVKFSEHWYTGEHAIDASFLKEIMA